MGFKHLKKEEINKLPKTSGVYAFNKGAQLLYIGKAANLQERVKNHFQKPTALWERLTLLRQGSGGQGKIGYLKTNSEIEALILEANLIKKYQPKYNVVWRDDKNYFYVGVTKEDYPRIFITHQIQNAKIKNQNDNSKFKIDYTGPFVDGSALKQTLKVLRKIFPYYTQKKHPQGLCPWCHLDLCPGPNPVKSEYQKNIKNLISILEGKSKTLLKNLKKEMGVLSKAEKFEEAAKIRNQILALEKVMAHAKIFREIATAPQSNVWPYKRIEAYDISNIQGEEATGAMVTFINGLPDKNFYRRFKIKIAAKPNDIAMIKECLARRFQHPEWPFPDLILIDGGRGQLSAAQSVVKYEIQNTKYKIQTMALAKKENKLYIKGNKTPILLKSLPREIFNLILQLRDEAHRFARKYHLKLREETVFKVEP